MINKNRGEDVFLDMTYGKAKYKLMRKVMFSLLKETNKILCYRCGKEMSEINYSLDHKEFWYDVDIKKFWDLDNISFSHLSCNSSFRRSPLKKRKGSTSKYIGVSKRTNKNGNVYVARIRHKEKIYNLGTFNNAIVAGLVYDIYAKLIGMRTLNSIIYPKDFKHIVNIDTYVSQFHNINYKIFIK